MRIMYVEDFGKSRLRTYPGRTAYQGELYIPSEKTTRGRAVALHEIAHVLQYAHLGFTWNTYCKHTLLQEAHASLLALSWVTPSEYKEAALWLVASDEFGIISYARWHKGGHIKGESFEVVSNRRTRALRHMLYFARKHGHIK